jgi:tripartite-type tricarboxylate transporter receptor subunit TctC
LNLLFSAGMVRLSGKWRKPMKRLCFALTMVLAALSANSVLAQNYPNRPIRIIAPFAAGGAVDQLARLIGNKMSESIGQPVLIENRTGVGGNLGADLVAKSPPDGYTILQTPNGQAISPALYRNLPFDPVKDFIPVTQLVASTLILVASPKSQITSLPELIALAKSKPGGLNYGSSGVGNPLHLTMEMLKHAAGIDILAVPYRGGDGHINAALIAGDVQVAVVPLATARPLIEEGQLRALAVTGARRSPALPNVPTVAEAGVPNFESSSWQGWFVAANTPRDVVGTIQREVRKALYSPDIQDRLKAMAYETVGSTPEEFDAKFKADLAKFAKVVKDARIPALD